MKVKPLCGHDMDEKQDKGNKEEVAGYITGLPVPEDGTFQLKTKWGETYTVDYSDAGYAVNPQPDIYKLLEVARDHMLKVRDLSEFIDIIGGTPIGHQPDS